MSIFYDAAILRYAVNVGFQKKEVLWAVGWQIYGSKCKPHYLTNQPLTQTKTPDTKIEYMY